MTVMHFESDGHRLHADLAQPLSLAIPLDFDGPQPHFHGADRAHSAPLRVPGFVGDTREGGSCNCEELRIVPHCNGTHTECVGHVTDERIFVSEAVRGGLALALVLSLRPTEARATPEGSDPPPAAGDWLLTAAAIRRGLETHPRLAAHALVLRTLPNGSDKITRQYAGESPAPYLTREAAELIVASGIEHLVLDLPSADRAHDHGRLTAHRIFFGLPPGSRHAGAAARPHTSITELAYVAPMIQDGWYLLDLQLPAFLADAAPSRPLLYPVRFD